MNDADLIQIAAVALKGALKERGVDVTPVALIWLLGQVWGESKFGTGPDWTIPNELNDSTNNPNAPSGPSYNWGAVRSSGDKFIWHKDRDQNGVLGTYKFARYDSHLDAARGYLGALLRTDLSPAVSLVLASNTSTPYDLARAMYTHNTDPNVTTPHLAYYTGTTGSDADRIQAYANLIQSGALRVAEILGVSAAQLAQSRAVTFWKIHKVGFAFAAIGIGFGVVAGVLQARHSR